MPGLLLPTSSKDTSKSSAAWSFSFRGGCESDSSESEGGEGEGNAADGGESRCSVQLSDDARLMKELDIASRAEADAAQFKANPWSIARINAASRTTDSKAANCSDGVNLAQEDTLPGNTKALEDNNKQYLSSGGQLAMTVPARRSGTPLGRLKKHSQLPQTGKVKSTPNSTIQRFLPAASEAIAKNGRKDVSSTSRSTSDIRRSSTLRSPATMYRFDTKNPSKASHVSDLKCTPATPTTVNDVDPTSAPIGPGTDTSVTKEIERTDALLLSTCDDSRLATTRALTDSHTFANDPALIHSQAGDTGDLQNRSLAESIESATSFVGPDSDTNRPAHPNLNSVNTQGGQQIASDVGPSISARNVIDALPAARFRHTIAPFSSPLRSVYSPPLTPRRQVHSSPPKLVSPSIPLSVMQRSRHTQVINTSRPLFPKSTSAKAFLPARPDLPTIASHGTSRNSFFAKSNEQSRLSNNKDVPPLTTYGFQANVYGSSKAMPTPVSAYASFDTTAAPSRHRSSALNGAQLEHDDRLNRADCRGLDYLRNVPPTEDTWVPDKTTFLSNDVTQHGHQDSCDRYRDNDNSLGVRALPDAYAAFSDDEDFTWSTLPLPKKSRTGHGGKNSTIGSTGVKQSGRFKLPLSLMPDSSAFNGLPDTAPPKRRVVTYLPPPRCSPAPARTSEHLSAQASRTPLVTDRAVRVDKPVEKWKITRLGYNPDTGMVAEASGMCDCDQNDVCSSTAAGHMVKCAPAGSTSRSKSDGLDSDTTLLNLHSSDVLSSDGTQYGVARYDIADAEDRYPDVRKAMVESKEATRNTWDVLGLPSCGVLFKDAKRSSGEEKEGNASELGIICWESAH